MKHFVKLNNWWWEYDANLPIECTTLYNTGFGKRSQIDINGMETTTAEDFNYLNWYGTKAYDNSYLTGWVSPSGEFFGCDFTMHSFHATYVQNKHERELEEDGWLKISYKIYYNKDGSQSLEAVYASKKHYPTNEQIAFVRNNYKGKEQQEMLGYLFMVRSIRKEQIKQDWGLQK